MGETENIFSMMREERTERSVQKMQNRQYIQARDQRKLAFSASLVLQSINSGAIVTSDYEDKSVDHGVMNIRDGSDSVVTENGVLFKKRCMVNLVESFQG